MSEVVAGSTVDHQTTQSRGHCANTDVFRGAQLVKQSEVAMNNGYLCCVNLVPADLNSDGFCIDDGHGTVVGRLHASKYFDQNSTAAVTSRPPSPG